MKKIIKCNNGHYYDPSRFDSCPHCDVSVNAEDEDNKTVSLSQDLMNSFGPVTREERREEPVETTISEPVKERTIYQEPKTVPSEEIKEKAVGWLMPITGSRQGVEYRIKDGNNRIGCGSLMDIQLDYNLSDAYFGNLVYDSMNAGFYLVAGTQDGMLLNDQNVSGAMELHSEDTITIQGDKYVFIAFCNENMRWE